MNGGFKYEVGMFGGSFDPLHQGHLNVIYRAASECRELYLVLSYSLNRDSVGYRTRAKWLHLAIRHLDNVRILLLEDDCKSKEEYDTSEHWTAGLDRSRNRLESALMLSTAVRIMLRRMNTRGAILIRKSSSSTVLKSRFPRRKSGCRPADSGIFFRNS